MKTVKRKHKRRAVRRRKKKKSDPIQGPDAKCKHCGKLYFFRCRCWHAEQERMWEDYNSDKTLFGRSLREIHEGHLRTCDICGKQFFFDHMSQKRCRSCVPEYQRRYSRGRKKVEHKKKRCEHCGHWFQPKRSTARFCKDTCRVYFNKELTKER